MFLRACLVLLNSKLSSVCRLLPLAAGNTSRQRRTGAARILCPLVFNLAASSSEHTPLEVSLRFVQAYRPRASDDREGASPRSEGVRRRVEAYRTREGSCRYDCNIPSKSVHLGKGSLFPATEQQQTESSGLELLQSLKTPVLCLELSIAG